MTWALILLDIDPNVVKPGWTPLLITIGIALAMVGLYLSMRRQFRRIDVTRDESAGRGASEDPVEPTTRPTP